MSIFTNVIDVIFKNLPEFFILLSRNRLHNQLRILSIVHKGATFTLGSLVGKSGQVSQQKTSDEILEPYGFEILLVVKIKPFSHVEEYFRAIINESLTDLFDRFVVFSVQKFVNILAGQVLFCEIKLF